MRCRLSFIGRVQGVGFRATARSVAAGFRVTGWVRNEPDGSVLLEIQGEPAEIEACLARLGEVMRKNIVSSRLDEVPDVAGEAGFSVQR